MELRRTAKNYIKYEIISVYYCLLLVLRQVSVAIHRIENKSLGVKYDTIPCLVHIRSRLDTAHKQDHVKIKDQEKSIPTIRTEGTYQGSVLSSSDCLHMINKLKIRRTRYLFLS